MSTILTRAGADYSLNASRFSPPVESGLQGWWYLGGMLSDDSTTAMTRTTKNLANTSHAMTPIVSPQIGTGFVQVNSLNYFSTTVPETIDFTWIFLMVPIDLNGNVAFYRNLSPVMQTIVNTTTANSFACYTPHDTGGGVPAQVNCANMQLGAGYTSMRLISWSMNGTTGASSCHDWTGGSNVTFNVTARMISDPVTGLRIGGNSQFAGMVQLGMFAIYNRALSDTELGALHAFIANYRLAKYGDTI